MVDISVKDLNKFFVIGENLLQGLSFEIQEGECVAILGRNGCGKTTLFKILTGEMDYDGGEVYVNPNKKLGLISQIPKFPTGYTVEDVLRTAFSVLTATKNKMEALEAAMAQGATQEQLREYDTLVNRFQSGGGYDMDVDVDKICNGLGITAEQRPQLFDSLSGGEKTRINLARLLLEKTDILLLDEPTNHLDLNSVEWLEAYIKAFKGTVLTISAAGSEGSDSCVITQENGNLKWGCPKTDVIRPKFSVLDPTYTCSLPDYQLACGAVDMLAHLCERYFTNTPDVALTDRLCEAVMKTVVDAAPRALAGHDDYAAHADLMWAGMLAHNNSCGIGREQDWASHQIEHELSAFYDCAHGAGLAVVMPAWMEYVCGHDPMRFARFAVNVFGCEMDYAHPERTAQAGIRRLREFFRALHMPAALQDVGGKAEDIPAMVAHRSEKPNGFPFGGFVKIHEADMEAILRRCGA